MIANLVKNLYDSELESIKRLTASSKKLVVVLNIGGVMQLTSLTPAIMLSG